MGWFGLAPPFDNRQLVRREQFGPRGTDLNLAPRSNVIGGGLFHASVCQSQIILGLCCGGAFLADKLVYTRCLRLFDPQVALIKVLARNSSHGQLVSISEPCGSANCFPVFQPEVPWPPTSDGYQPLH